MTKFLCVGDLHLNERSGLGPERLKDQERVWRDVLELADAEEVDAVLIPGDMWEHRRPTPAELRAFQRPLEDFHYETRHEILAIPGNHDVEHPDRPIALELFPYMLDARRFPSVWKAHGVTVATLPWAPVSRLVADANGGDRDDLNEVAAEHLLNVARGLREQISGPAILMLHWSVSGASTPDGLSTDLFREPVLNVFELEAMDWDAIVCGHIHKPQHPNSGGVADLGVTGSALGTGFQASALCDPALTGERRSAAAQPEGDAAGTQQPAALPVRSPFFYVGSPMPLNHGEAGCDHGAWILEGPPFTARFVPLESRRFLTLDYDFVAEPNLAGFVELSDFLGCDPPINGDIVRLRFACTEEQSRRIDQAAIKRALLDAGAWRVDVRAEIVRAERARVQAMTVDLDETAALGLWLDEQGVTDREPLLALHALYLGEVRA